MFNNISVESNNNNVDFFSALEKEKYNWHEHDAEGQLAVDIAQNKHELIIVAPMSGTPPEKIGLHLQNDLLTIRGERVSPAYYNSKHYHQEVYWGKFSRTIVLPCDVSYELAKAEYKNGVLVITLPKRMIEENIKIMVIDE